MLRNSVQQFGALMNMNNDGKEMLLAAKKQKLSPPQSLKAFIVEYHNDALSLIHRQIARRYLPFKEITILHLDSHPDLCFPIDVEGDFCFKPKELYEVVDICEWMLPLVFASHVNQILWWKPIWADQIPSGIYEGFVGLNKDGLMRTTLLCDYFIEECMYESEEYLSQKKEFKLVVFCSKDASHDTAELIMKYIDKNTSYILDIDLDYFSTLNPFRKVFSEDEISFLQRIYSFEKPDYKCYKSIQNSMIVYTKKMNSFETIIKRFAEREIINFNDNVDTDHKDVLDTFPCFEAFLSSKKNEESSGNKPLDLIHNAGKCAELPHNVSSELEIDELISVLKTVLKSISKPKLITIARSSVDDFTPEEQVDLIQERLSAMLNHQYIDLIIDKQYDKDDIQ